jgi:hypothetical protein
MTTAVDAKLFSNIAATTAPFELKGGYYMVAAVFTGTSVELQALGPDQATFLSLPTPAKLTASGMIAATYLPPGQYQFTLTAVTACSCSVAGVPIS